MGSRLRQLRLFKIAVVLAAIVGATVLVSAAFGSSFEGVNGKLAFYANAGNGTPGYIATANADGTGQTRISIPNPKTDQGDFGPRFSADGTQVVFTRNASKVGYDKLQIWIADANVSASAKATEIEHEVNITGLPANTFPDAPTFTPDGKNIVFSIDTINAPIGLGEVSVNGGKATRIATGNDWQPAVSPDGTKIAFISGYDLVVADFNQAKPQSVSNVQTLYTEPQSASSMDLPDWSPDGADIAFDELSSGVWDIWTIAADGSDNATATNLTNGTTTSSLDPAYSPDGTKIAFTAVDNSSYAASIDVMDADGSNAKPVITPQKGFVGGPDWGVKSSAAPRPTVVTVSPAGGAKKVADTTTVTATWNAPLTAKTLVLTAAGKKVKGTTTCSAACSVVTFKPAAPLSAHTTYTATATGTNGSGKGRKKWRFETK